MKKMQALAIGCVLSCVALAHPAMAQSGTIFSTSFKSSATAYLGSEHRETVNKLLEAGVSIAEGREGLQPVLAWCDAKTSDDEVTYVSVNNEDEAEDFRTNRPHAKQVVLIDAACPMAYKAMAFWAVEAGDLEAALPWLEKAIRIGPLFDEAYTERGFVLNQLHRAAEGADSYRQALAILERHPHAESKGVALRGLGYSLVELGDLPAARKAYEDSLVVVPGNKGAMSEIEYIDGLEKAKK
jgi:tetratricopeptide (TPR) repeat protein